MISARYILREMFAEKTRIILTIIAIAWATFSITTMLAVGQGLRITFGTATQGVGDNVIFVKAGQASENYQGNAINTKINILPKDIHSLSNQIPEIKNYSEQYEFPAKLSYQRNSFPATVSAVNPEFAQMRNIIVTSPGRFIDNLDMQQARRVIVLGNSVADTLFPNGDALGKTILVANQPFIIIGVMKPKFQIAGPQDAYNTWIPVNTYHALNSTLPIKTLVVTPNKADDADVVKSSLLKKFALENHLNPTDPSILDFRDFQDMQSKTSDLFLGMEIFLGIIGLMTLIVAGVGIANVMFISIKRATKEIGLRMAIGARSHQVLIHYVFEAMIATAIGGFIGICFAELLIKAISFIPMHGKFFQFVGKPIPQLSYPIIFIVIIILGIIGFLAGFFPARRAANIDPAVALREE